MRTATDLKERIVAKAGDLFIDQGYVRTTNKHIADAVGSTTASLYYYFPNGKKQLLREVALAHVTEVTAMFASLQDAQSLPELLQQLSATAIKTMPLVAGRMSWLHAEFHHVDEEDKVFVRQQMLKIHSGIKALLARFISDKKAAHQLAWFLMGSAMGHFILFDKMGMSVVEPNFDRQQMFQVVMRSIGLPR